jgi:hypothetical protein
MSNKTDSPDPKISDGVTGVLVKVRCRGSPTGQDPYLQTTECNTTNRRLCPPEDGSGGDGDEDVYELQNWT